MAIIPSLVLMLGANAFAQSSTARGSWLADLADRSAMDFVQLIDHRCANVAANSEEMAACTKDSARLWLADYAWRYESIPDSYITGDAIARDFVTRP
jgi:hypothetical protein